MMKLCFKCRSERPVEQFYRHSKMADGRLNKCKECTKADVKENRKQNYEYYKEFDRKRANLPHRVKARKEYSKTENYKKSTFIGRKKYIQNNPDKRKAHVALNNAIRDKKITKPSICECCGSGDKKIHAHHDDYSKPLVVRWLCFRCHYALHKAERLNEQTTSS